MPAAGEGQTGEQALVSGYDAVLSDLDGVVYAGPNAIPGAVSALQRLSATGVALGYVTNNASRSPSEVAGHLRELGAPADPSQVISSSQAGARLLADRLGTRPGGRPPAVLIIGSDALAREVEAVGLRAVYGADDGPDAVIQGFDPALGWSRLAEATYAVRAGALWVATNTDMTIPRDRGIAPGNGTLVAAVQAASGVDPVVAGKPEAPIFHAAAERLGARTPLIVGDRLDTDILGGHKAGMDTAAVLTGVDSLESILAAPSAERPTYLFADLDGLYEPYPDIWIRGEVYGCRDWSAWVHDGEIHVGRGGHGDFSGGTGSGGTGSVDGRGGGAMLGTGRQADLDGWRAACAAWWAAHPDAATTTSPRFARA